MAYDTLSSTSISLIYLTRKEIKHMYHYRVQIL